MNRENVEEALSKVIYPGFQKDIVSFGFIDKIDIFGNDVSIELTITSSSKDVKEQLEKDINIDVTSITKQM